MRNWKRPRSVISPVRAVVDTSFWIDPWHGNVDEAEKPRLGLSLLHHDADFTRALKLPEFTALRAG